MKDGSGDQADGEQPTGAGRAGKADGAKIALVIPSRTGARVYWPRFTLNRRTWVLRPAADELWDRCAVLLATGLGVGFIPVMPGTFGSLLGLPIAWLFGWSGWPAELVLAAKAALLLAGVPLCGRAARRLGGTDPAAIVYDEIAALQLVFLSAPLTLTTAILGFIWFRIFDIAKPWPVRRLERLPGGWGIMLDDVAAALFAAAATWLSLAAFSLGGSHSTAAWLTS
jgi:phosphatidylglycerophosphatase A